MNEAYYPKIAAELNIRPHQVSATAALLAEGATVPFIARYRKERTDSLDEVAIAAVRDRLGELEALDARREAILKSLAEQGVLTGDLTEAVNAAQTLAALEDIYLPFRPKRRTRAAIAREKGLEPLAEKIFSQEKGVDPLGEARAYVDAEKGIETPEDALAGARDIIAERISEDAGIRSALRALFEKEAVLKSEVYTGAEEEGATYRDYFHWSEPAAKAPGHRILAVFRGSREAFLKLSVRPDEGAALGLLEKHVAQGDGPCADQVRLACTDGYKRLLAPSLENEIKARLKDRADDEAIEIFARNLRELLMAPAMGQRRVLAIDPGLRTGCKVVCLDAQGALLHHDVIFPGFSGGRAGDAAARVRDLVSRFSVEVVAVGNGTGGRETEAFVRGLDLGIPVVMVNESGASVYSASEAARREFPEHDVTVRGAVSIGRRLMDPLAELVKIDPKAIGVGQYQHDVDQGRLKRKLDDVVQSCVNAVGVEVNTASPELLAYVSGLGASLAANIVAYRTANGPFPGREALLKVPRLGARAFEQAAGFLRVRGAAHPLDASAVHPERYGLVERMAADLGCTLTELMGSRELRARIDLKRYVGDGVGLPTLEDILSELDRPGRDPRREFEVFSFTEGIERLEDLQTGMELAGIVTNVTRFGAFVDIGVHQDGLVHISQLADRYVKDPSDVVKVNQKVSVKVLEVDLKRRRISLTMKGLAGRA
ncbi:MAG TPA: Tex family protein [Deltaproteobacteria bacterium]|nr:Tex family protein [Deltaproteobacteria bacterium]